MEQPLIVVPCCPVVVDDTDDECFRWLLGLFCIFCLCVLKRRHLSRQIYNKFHKASKTSLKKMVLDQIAETDGALLVETIEYYKRKVGKLV